MWAGASPAVRDEIPAGTLFVCICLFVCPLRTSGACCVDASPYGRCVLCVFSRLPFGGGPGLPIGMPVKPYN